MPSFLKKGMAEALALRDTGTVEDKILTRDELEKLYGENYRLWFDTKNYCPHIYSCAYVNGSKGSICHQDWYGHILCDIFRNSFDDGK